MLWFHIYFCRGVTESINNLIDTFMQAAPGQKECDNALRNIQTMKNILDNINEPINDWTYFDCLQGVMEKSKVRALAEFINQRAIFKFLDQSFFIERVAT